MTAKALAEYEPTLSISVVKNAEAITKWAARGNRNANRTPQTHAPTLIRWRKETLERHHQGAEVEGNGQGCKAEMGEGERRQIPYRMNWKTLFARLASRKPAPPRPPVIRGHLNMDYRPSPDVSQFPHFLNNVVDLESKFTRPANSGKILVYYSLGEVLPSVPYFSEIKRNGIKLMGGNSEWGSQYIDVRDKRWADLLIKLIGGYGWLADGIFFDTADSYWALDNIEPGHLDEFIRGTASIINRVKAAFPDKIIIPNRCFHAFPQIKNSISGFLFEGLYQKWSGGYVTQTREKRLELLTLSEPIKAAGKPIYVVDYVPENDLSMAQTTATQIKQAGFHPLVTAGPDLVGKVLAS